MVLSIGAGGPHETLVPRSCGNGDTAFLIHEVIVLHGKIPHVHPEVCRRGYAELAAVPVGVVVTAEFVSVDGLVATGGEETEGAAPTEAAEPVCA